MEVPDKQWQGMLLKHAHLKGGQMKVGDPVIDLIEAQMAAAMESPDE